MRRSVQWLCSLCLVCAGAAHATASEDYSIYVILPTNKEMKDKYGRNLEKIVDYEQTPFDVRGMRVLNAGAVGEYPFAGIHVVESDSNYMERHYHKIRNNLYRWVDPDYDGVVIIDYEAWWAAWDHTANVPSGGGPGDRDRDFKDDWEDYLERYRPEVLTGKTGAARQQALRDTYEESTVRFLVDTLRECKRLCPDAKWGYFNYPKMFYGSEFTGSGTIGYGDLSHYASRINDRLAPLWAEIDVTAPRIFPPRLTVPVREVLIRDNNPEQQYTFLSSHEFEARRVAPHALCVPLGSTRYFGAHHKDLSGIMISERNTWMQFTVPRDAGAAGVCIWGDAMSDEMATMTAAYMNGVAGPIANELWDTWYAGHAATPTPSGAVADPKPTAGGEEAVPASIPAHLRIRYARSLEKPTWGAVRRGSVRVSIPAHSPSASTSAPVHRGARIVGRRAIGTGDSPPQHRPALVTARDSDDE